MTSSKQKPRRPLWPCGESGPCSVVSPLALYTCPAGHPPRRLRVGWAEASRAPAHLPRGQDTEQDMGSWSFSPTLGFSCCRGSSWPGSELPNTQPSLAMTANALEKRLFQSFHLSWDLLSCPSSCCSGRSLLGDERVTNARCYFRLCLVVLTAASREGTFLIPVNCNVWIFFPSFLAFFFCL